MAKSAKSRPNVEYLPWNLSPLNSAVADTGQQIFQVQGGSQVPERSFIVGGYMVFFHDNSQANDYPCGYRYLLFHHRTAEASAPDISSANALEKHYKNKQIKRYGVVYHKVATTEPHVLYLKMPKVYLDEGEELDLWVYPTYTSAGATVTLARMGKIFYQVK